MRKVRHQWALEDHFLAQSVLLEAYGRRGARPGSPRPVRVDCLVQLLQAAALTGTALARIVTAPPEYLLALPCRLPLPKLPRQPDRGSTPHPLPKIAKQPQ